MDLLSNSDDLDLEDLDPKNVAQCNDSNAFKGFVEYIMLIGVGYFKEQDFNHWWFAN